MAYGKDAHVKKLSKNWQIFSLFLRGNESALACPRSLEWPRIRLSAFRAAVPPFALSLINHGTRNAYREWVGFIPKSCFPALHPLPPANEQG
jgi:hypothetical protein